MTVGPTTQEFAPSSDPRRRFLQLSGWLDEKWYRDHAPVAIPDDGDVIAHYLEHGAPAGLAPNGALQSLHDGTAQVPDRTATEAPTVPSNDDPQLALEIELVRASGLFDPQFYARQLEAAGIKVRPRHRLQHFCQRGWREALRPSARFEVWWYWTNFLDPRLEATNPLVHYILLGQAAGYPPMPSVRAARPPGGGAFPDQPRRICLFAGYDPHGKVDDYVLEYVRELGRFADVYYLCDGYLEPDELAKLRPLTSGAWAIRHAAYDFGSWSMLAGELVGWETIEAYDELLLVNDSCYLLRPLDEVFAKMAASDCDWWGMQATKGMSATRRFASNAQDVPIPLDEVRERLLPTFDADEIYDFHVGSYFLAYRRPVIDDAHFRRLLNSVHRQRTKFSVVVKYEIGMTRFLTGNGYRFDTYIDALYPFHPIFTDWYFELLEQGFPLLKKFLLYRNHYEVANLARWKERIVAEATEAPVDLFERNLLRTAPHDDLSRSFAIVTDQEGQVVAPERLTAEGFRELDETTAKRDDCWAFVVSHDQQQMPDNSRAIFEQVRHDPAITKIVLTRSHHVDLDGANVHVVPLDSPEGWDLLARSRFVFVNERPFLALKQKFLSAELHDLVLVRDGLELMRFGHAANLDAVERRPRRKPGASAILASSDVDQLAMLSAHYIVDYPRAWRTGIPALDFVVCEHSDLPTDLQAAETRLREQLGGRRLVLFAPAAGRSTLLRAYPFSVEELDWLRSWAERHDLVLGLREHPADTEHTYLSRLGDVVVNLSSFEHPHLPVLLRVADAIVTDFSGVGLDFMVTGRPVVSFVHDLDEVSPRLFYDLERVMPGPVCREFSELATALDRLFEPPDAVARRRYERSRRLFLDHLDPHSAARAVAVIRSLRPTSKDAVST